MRRYIHLCGLSAVGKKSLIRKILHPDGYYFRDKFHIEGKVAAFGPRFERSDTEPREIPYPDHVYEGLLSSDADVVIHQWQWAQDHLVLNLRSDKEHDRHEAYLLWKPWEVHRMDICEYRSYWHPAVGELKVQWADLKSRATRWEAAGIEVKVLDSRTLEELPW